MFTSKEETQLLWFSVVIFIMVCIFRLWCQNSSHSDSSCRMQPRRKFSDPNQNGKLAYGDRDGFGKGIVSNRRGRRPISLKHL